jgi:DNA-binding protein HU-beta
MKKTELVDHIADTADLSKAAAGRTLDAILETITESLVDGEDVTLIGFGTFKISERAARDGRNPRTGEAIKIAASKVPSFKAGKALKDAVNL